MNPSYDVAIIGGGPAGSTCAALLRKYDPSLRVLVLERERFPRDHVGESQLPPIGAVLNEMGCWEEVEAANFPIKIGATYRWGCSDELWNFEFVSGFQDEPRPAKYAGQRTQTALQVDRAVYDRILLDHARELGAEVRQETRVVEVLKDGDRVTGLRLDDGSVVEAVHYVDASGHVGVLRRAMGVGVECPTSLQNIAIWDYWQNAEWAVEIGVGGTRVQVLSLDYGWIWFIPLGPTRTSIGLILPADYYRRSGRRPQDLYEEAVRNDPVVSRLIQNARSEGALATTKDWSFVADRLAGDNWWLAGESAGFADPILAAGMTLAHWSAREAAYTILELNRGEHDGGWLKARYQDLQRRRLRQHIQFADFWYSANGNFEDLKDYTRQIAQEAGLDLDPDAAFQWLGTGGFINERLGATAAGTVDIRALRGLCRTLTDRAPRSLIADAGSFRLDLEGAQTDYLADYVDGRVVRVKTYVRGESRLPLTGAFQAVVRSLKWGGRSDQLLQNLMVYRETYFPAMPPGEWLNATLQVLEALVLEGWVHPQPDPAAPPMGRLVPELTH